MDAPANTLSYMIGGYAVIFVVMVGYLASLLIRYRNLRQDEEMLENLKDEAPQSSVSHESVVNTRGVR